MPAENFRPEFVTGIVRYFISDHDNLTDKERAHAAGVVANTMAAYAIDLSRGIDISSMKHALQQLSRADQRMIMEMIKDPSTEMLHQRSMHLIQLIVASFEEESQATLSRNSF